VSHFYQWKISGAGKRGKIGFNAMFYTSNTTTSESMMKKTLLAAILFAVAMEASASGEALTVFKDPNCGCCAAWIAYLKEAGYRITVKDTADMSAVKAKLGVPAELQSCHTAVVDETGQVIEGHVPAAAVAKLISRPAVKGVAVPGMPMNAPGMGVLDGNLTTVDFAGKPFSKN
jgi:hypothetical protein